MITPQQAIARLIDNNELFHDEMTDLMRQIMSGQVAPEQIAAILTGLRIKVETVSEISAAAAVMREFATPVPVAERDHLVDIVGTGGDGAKTFNISTTAMFVAAAAGAKVAKHGGRSVSSACGAADVVEEMGVPASLTAEQVGQSINDTGIGFMFAANHHSAMRYVAPVRKLLGFRSIFNILGPLTNPAGAPNQLLGVFHRDLCGILSRVLQQLGSRHVLVVHGSDGLDEITLTGHAMEVRLYAEDSAHNFLPQTGRVLRWEPELLEGIRIDHGLVEGQEVTPFYDPMLAKVIAYGATREDARRKLVRALENCVLLGVNGNQRFLANLLANPKVEEAYLGG